jgi:hypothetical protein
MLTPQPFLTKHEQVGLNVNTGSHQFPLLTLGQYRTVTGMRNQMDHAL